MLDKAEFQGIPKAAGAPISDENPEKEINNQKFLLSRNAVVTIPVILPPLSQPQIPTDKIFYLNLIYYNELLEFSVRSGLFQLQSSQFFMNRYLPKVLIATLLASFSPQVFAQTNAPSALTVLRGFSRDRGAAESSRVVGLVGFFGQSQPAQWLILQLDAKNPNLLHEYAVRAGRPEAYRRFWRDPAQDLPTIPIVLSRVAVDSNRAFVLADQNARMAGIGFDSIHYQLRCRDLRNEPIWVLNLINGTQRSVGVLYISAITGETLRSVWYRPGATTSVLPDSQSAPARPKGLIPQLSERFRDNQDAPQPPPPAGFSAPPVPPRSGR